MKRTIPCMPLLLASLAVVAVTARGQYCDPDFDDCENIIVDGPFCAGDFLDGCGAGGSLASYAQFTAESWATCYDTYYGYFWAPLAEALEANPYRCGLNVVEIGSAYSYSVPGWAEIDGVLAYAGSSDGVYSFVTQDCFYDGAGNWATDTCSGTASLLIQDSVAPA